MLHLLKQTSCWLQRAPQRRIQRLMTSPISPLRSMLKLGRVILPMSCMLSCIAQFLHHIWIAICLVAYLIVVKHSKLKIWDVTSQQFPMVEVISMECRTHKELKVRSIFSQVLSATDTTLRTPNVCFQLETRNKTTLCV